MLRSTALLLAASAAHALSVSDITPDAPGLSGWVTYDQDNFTAQSDDKYTGGARAGAVIGPWTLAGNYAVLTDRVHDYTRSDEAALTLSRRFGDFTVGAGGVVSGDLHGDRIQHTVHTWDSSPQYELAYGSNTARPLVVGTYELDLYDYNNGRTSIDNHSSTIRWRTGGFWAWDMAQVRSGLFMATGRWADRSCVYAEPFLLIAAGDALSETAAKIWPRPASVGMSLGVLAEHAHLGIIMDLNHIYGHIGIVF